MARFGREEALDWFRQAIADSRAYRSGEAEKKRAGELSQIELQSEGALERQGLANAGQFNVQGLAGRQGQALETLKNTLAKPVTKANIAESTARGGYYDALAGVQSESARKLKLDNDPQERLNAALPTRSLVDEWYSANPGATNPYRVDLTTKPAPAVPSLIDLEPQSVPNTIPDAASSILTAPFGNPLGLQNLKSLSDYLVNEDPLFKKNKRPFSEAMFR